MIDDDDYFFDFVCSHEFGEIIIVLQKISSHLDF